MITAGSSKLELCTMKKGSDEANHHKMWHDGEDPAFEKYFSSAEDPVINKMVRSLLCSWIVPWIYTHSPSSKF